MEPTPPNPKSLPSRFAGDVAARPVWHKLALGIGVVLLIAGIAGHVMNHAAATPAGVQSVGQPTVAPIPGAAGGGGTSSLPGGSSGFVSGTPQFPTGRTPSASPAASPAASAQPIEPTPTATSAAPSWMTGIGGGFVGGYIVGWLFRVFVKIMMLLTFAAAAIIGGLSYFHVINVDFSAAREKYDTSQAWLESQADKLKNAAFAHFASSGTGLAGLIVGMKRR